LRRCVIDLAPLRALKQVEKIHLGTNKITDLTPLIGLARLREIDFRDNPALTKSQIEQLKKAHPNCGILHNARDN
jgi:Leucine-rich repeat (LRR) protein